MDSLPCDQYEWTAELGPEHDEELKRFHRVLLRSLDRFAFMVVVAPRELHDALGYEIARFGVEHCERVFLSTYYDRDDPHQLVESLLAGDLGADEGLSVPVDELVEHDKGRLVLDLNFSRERLAQRVNGPCVFLIRPELLNTFQSLALDLWSTRTSVFKFTGHPSRRTRLPYDYWIHSRQENYWDFSRGSCDRLLRRIETTDPKTLESRAEVAFRWRVVELVMQSYRDIVSVRYLRQLAEQAERFELWEVSFALRSWQASVSNRETTPRELQLLDKCTTTRANVGQWHAKIRLARTPEEQLAVFQTQLADQRTWSVLVAKSIEPLIRVLRPNPAEVQMLIQSIEHWFARTRPTSAWGHYATWQLTQASMLHHIGALHESQALLCRVIVEAHRCGDSLAAAVATHAVLQLFDRPALLHATRAQIIPTAKAAFAFASRENLPVLRDKLIAAAAKHNIALT